MSYSVRYILRHAPPIDSFYCTASWTQLLDGGELLDAVAGLAIYTEHDARLVAKSLLEALAHAHNEARCIHRDLQPSNLLLAAGPSVRPELGRRVKIAGWGRAKHLPDSGLVPGEQSFGVRGAAGFQAGVRVIGHQSLADLQA